MQGRVVINSPLHLNELSRASQSRLWLMSTEFCYPRRRQLHEPWTFASPRKLINCAKRACPSAHLSPRAAAWKIDDRPTLATNYSSFAPDRPICSPSYEISSRRIGLRVRFENDQRLRSPHSSQACYTSTRTNHASNQKGRRRRCRRRLTIRRFHSARKTNRCRSACKKEQAKCRRRSRSGQRQRERIERVGSRERRCQRDCASTWRE